MKRPEHTRWRFGTCAVYSPFFLFALVLPVLLLSGPAAACVGKTLIIGTDGTARSRAVAQVLAILINERTGTTVEVLDHPNADALFKGLTEGDVDLALEFAGRALSRGGQAMPGEGAKAFEAANAYYQETWNLVWLPPLGFSEEGHAASVAAPIAQKHALKKFPALSRLIAKTQSLLPEAEIAALASAANQAQAAREFLKKNKLI